MDDWVGKRVRARRQAMGMTGYRLGELLGVGRQQVEKWEKGEVRLSAGHIYEVAVQLQVAPGWFFELFPIANAPENGAPDVDLVFRMAEAMPALLAYARLNRVERDAIMVLMVSLGHGRAPTLDGERPLYLDPPAAPG